MGASAKCLFADGVSRVKCLFAGRAGRRGDEAVDTRAVVKRGDGAYDGVGGATHRPRGKGPMHRPASSADKVKSFSPGRKRAPKTEPRLTKII